jgi:hypothetical protein
VSGHIHALAASLLGKKPPAPILEGVTLTPYITVEGKVGPVLNEAPSHKDVWRSGGIAPCILNFGPERR